jgi:hypothetical protein
MKHSQEDWEAEFDHIGAGEVRAKLEMNAYLHESALWARAWLARNSEASQAEQLALARAAALIVAIVAAIISLWK